MLEYFDDELEEALLYVRSQPANVKGELVYPDPDPAPTAITIIKPQPVTGQDRQYLPDGDHVRDYSRTYTMDEIPSIYTSSGPFILASNGTLYRIQNVQDRRNEQGATRILMRAATDDEYSIINPGV